MESLWAAVEAPGCESVDILALADALDEAGERGTATALRWGVKAGKWPMGRAPGYEWSHWKSGFSSRFTLPNILLNEMTTFDSETGHYAYCLQKAWEDVGEAFDQLLPVVDVLVQYRGT